MSDLNFQQLSTVQDNVMLGPATIASATTIAPTTFLTFVSGTVAVGTITPPVTGTVMLAFVFTNASPAATVTTGNIALATTTVQNKTLFMTYDPAGAKWYPSY